MRSQKDFLTSRSIYTAHSYVLHPYEAKPPRPIIPPFLQPDFKVTLRQHNERCRKDPLPVQSGRQIGYMTANVPGSQERISSRCLSLQRNLANLRYRFLPEAVCFAPHSHCGVQLADDSRGVRGSLGGPGITVIGEVGIAFGVVAKRSSIFHERRLTAA